METKSAFRARVSAILSARTGSPVRYRDLPVVAVRAGGADDAWWRLAPNGGILARRGSVFIVALGHDNCEDCDCPERFARFVEQ